MTQAQLGARFMRYMIRASAVLSLFALMMVLVLYVVHFNSAHFSSDDAVANMLAQAMVEQGQLFPKGWVYNNGDLMVPSGALIIAYVIPWLQNGFLAHAVSGLFASATLIAALIWLLRTLKMNWDVVVATTSLLVSGVSLLFAVSIFTQTTYFWWPAGFMVGAALIFKDRIDRSVRQDRFRPRLLTVALLFMLVFFISFANPPRVLVMVVAPLYLFDRAIVHITVAEGASPALGRRTMRLLGLDDALTAIGIGCAFLCAFLCYKAVRSCCATDVVYAAANLHWAGWEIGRAGQVPLTAPPLLRYRKMR